MASQNTVTTDAKSFTLFQNLPRELRMMIWKLALPGPRILELEYHHARAECTGPVMQGHFSSPSPLHDVLATCREARHDALNQYRLNFPGMAERQTVVFDPTQDIIAITHLSSPYCEADEPLIAGNDAVWEQVQHICLLGETVEESLAFLNGKLVDAFPGLRSLIIGKEKGGPLGTPVLVEPQLTDEERLLCAAKIEEFKANFAKKMVKEGSGRVLPTLELKTVTRILGDMGAISVRSDPALLMPLLP